MSTFASNVLVKNVLSHLDWLVIAVILLLHASAILYSQKNKSGSMAECLVMSRRLALPIFVPSLVVAWYGKIFTVSQIAFDNGIYNFYTQGAFWYIAYMFFAFYLVKKVRAYNAVTLPDLISKMYGDKSTSFAAILLFIKVLPITYLISLSMALQLFMNISFLTATCIIIFGLALSVMVSTMRSLVYSNVIHFICMFLSIALVLIFSIAKLGGVNFLQSNLPATYFHPRGVHNIANMLSWFVLAFSTTIISPVFYQHCLAAKNDRTATIGILLATVFWILIDLCTTGGAMYAKAILPDADSVYAYCIYSMQLLPNGLKGLFVAGIIGTIIPSITVYLSIARDTLYHDVLTVKKYNANSLIMIAVMCIIISMSGYSIFFNENVPQIWIILKSYFTGCLLVPVLIGYFTKIMERRFFFVSALTSCFAMTAWQVCNIQNVIKIELMLIGCISSMIVFIAKYYQNVWNKQYSYSINKV